MLQRKRKTLGQIDQSLKRAFYPRNILRIEELLLCGAQLEYYTISIVPDESTSAQLLMYSCEM